MDYNYDRWSALAQVWGPRVIGAIVILLVAWLVGRALKWAIAKGVDKLPAVSHHNRTADPKGTVGHRLGDVAYWLVLLFGVLAALNALQLGAVAAPVNTLLNNIFGYLPNIVGALLIFFIGFILATLAQKLTTSALQAANADRWLVKAGLGGGSGGLSTVLGTVVFVLIIIPVAIAALQQLGIEAISRPAIAVLSTILNAVPNVIAAAIVLGIGWFIGRWIGGVVTNLLAATAFDRTVGALGQLSSYGASSPPASPTVPMTEGGPASTSTATVGGSGPSKWVGNLVLFAVVAFSAIEAARLLQFEALAGIVEQVLGLAGRVIVGGVLIMAGVLIADVLGNAISRSSSQQDRFVATLVRWATIALSVAMGLRFMGIADEIVILAFGLILGSAAVAAALAFGIGGKEAAGKVANRWASQVDKPPQ